MRERKRGVAWGLASGALAAALIGGVACGGASGGAESPSAPEIARIHKARCGQCHRRVEPGQRTRAELEAAFVHHRKRVHLTEEQWAAMVSYLAADDAGADAAP